MKRIFCAIILLYSLAWAKPVQAQIDSAAFVTVWTTTNDTIVFPGLGTNFTISWSCSNGYTGSTTASGTPTTILTGFGTDSTVTDTISVTNNGGTFNGFYYGYTTMPQTLLQVLNWGDSIHWTQLNHAFSYCPNLTITATDVPDLSGVTDLSYLFYGCTKLTNIPNINNWNVSNVTDMSYMFAGVNAFNQSLNDWDVSKVQNMSHMFWDASAFNQPLNSWNTGSVTNTSSMFAGANAFNQQIGNWNVSKDTNMNAMFWDASAFNQPLNSWNTANVTNMSAMFWDASAFNQPLNNWNTGNVTDMNTMFAVASSFNQSLNSWNTGNVTDMSMMFANASAFDQPLNSWNVSKVTNMSAMFCGASVFNQPLNNWNTGNVTNTSMMFANASAFKQPLNSWNVSNNTNTSGMFGKAIAFNQPLDTWNLSKDTSMSYMFYENNSFNQPLNTWNVSEVTNMSYMFYSASAFNQSLGDWNLSSITFSEGNDFGGLVYMLDSSGLDCYHYDSTLTGWADNLGATTPSVLQLGAVDLQYGMSALNARNALLNAGWSITDNGQGSCGTSLPITLLSFTAQAQNNNTVLLQWITETEINNKGFTVQRSADGVTWTDITFINSLAANGNSSVHLNYRYIDQTPLSGYNYYRLRQEDLDGTINYSDIQEVKLDIVGAQIYPNPASSVLYVQLSNTAANITYNLISASGSIVQRGILRNGKNTLSVNNLASGVYFLQVISNGMPRSYEIAIIR